MRADQSGTRTGAERVRRVDALGRGLAAVSLALALVALLGWAAGIPGARHLWLPGQPIRPSGALLVVLLAVAVLLGGRRLATVLGVLVALPAGLHLLAWAFDARLGLAERTPDVVGLAAPEPGVTLVAAAMFLLLGLFAVLRGCGVRRAADALPLGAAGIAILSVLGHLYDVDSLVAVVATTNAAPPTAILVLMLSSAALLRNGDGVLPWVLLDRGAGGTFARRLVPLAVLALPAAGYARRVAEDSGLIGPRASLVLGVVIASTLVLLVTAFSARRVDRIDRARREVVEQLELLNASLRDGRDAAWRRAEELAVDLTEEKARFNRSVAKLDDFLWTVEVLPKGRLELVFSSVHAEGIVGGTVPTGQDIGFTMMSLVHPDDLDAHFLFYAKVAEGEPAEAQMRLVGYDEVTRWVWTRGQPRREGDRLFYDGITTNVTEQRTLTEQREKLLRVVRQQLARLKELDALREELLAITGHELRTPLAVVKLLTEMLVADASTSDDHRRHLETVLRHVQQLDELVGDLFDAAQVSSGLAELGSQEVDLEQLVVSAVVDHRLAAASASLELTVVTEPATVTGDAVRLRQVLDNLLSNAVKYSPEAGRIDVALTDRDGYAVVTVADRGIGIPADELGRVFERSYRASTARGSAISGTGMGLSVARSLVEGHGGMVSAARRPGGGTVFTVELPSAGALRLTPASGSPPRSR